jgi:hypothetical protein
VICPASGPSAIRPLGQTHRQGARAEQEQQGEQAQDTQDLRGEAHQSPAERGGGGGAGHRPA